MFVAAAEFLVWSTIGLILGFLAHWWKSNADPYPDILDKDRPMLNILLTEHTSTNYTLGHRYDDAGYWEYYSLRNLKFYLGSGVVGMWLLVYSSSEMHAVIRGGFCSGAQAIGLTPIFCP